MRKYRLTYLEGNIAQQLEMKAENSQQASALFNAHKPNCKITKLEEGPIVQMQNFIDDEPKTSTSLFDDKPSRTPEENARLEMIARQQAAQTAGMINPAKFPPPQLENLNEDFVNKLFDPNVMQQVKAMPALSFATPTPTGSSASPMNVAPVATERYKVYKNGLRLDMKTMKLQKEDWVVLDRDTKVIGPDGNVLQDCIVQIKEWVDHE